MEKLPCVYILAKASHSTLYILREKRIKRWSRAWKYELIHKNNPTWRDLAEDFGFPPCY
jgi:predicted GIY-YIG superfamily endonuclease